MRAYSNAQFDLGCSVWTCVSSGGSVDLDTFARDCVAHALRHVETVKSGRTASPVQVNTPLPATPLVLSSELVDVLQVALAQVTVTEEEHASILTALQGEQANTSEEEDEQEMNTYKRVQAHLVRSPEAHVREIAEALAMSPSTAHKWRNRVRGTQMVS